MRKLLIKLLIKLALIFFCCVGSTFATSAVIYQASPNHLIAGSGDSTITVYGDRFQSAGTLNFDGVSVATTYILPSIITAVIPAVKLTIGTHALTFTGTSLTVSNTLLFPVVTPLAVVNSYSPTFFDGSQDVLVTVHGQDFQTNATILFDWQPIPITTFVDTNTLTGTVPAASVTGSGPHHVYVYNGPFPGGSVTYVQPPQFGLGTISVSAPTVNFQNGGVIRDNTGTVTLGTPWFTLTGTDAGSYSMSPGSCSDALVMMPGDTCLFSVNAIPTTAGTKNATLSVFSNATNSPQVSALSYVASTALTMSVTPSSLSFGSVATGGASSSLSLSVTAAFGSFTLSTPFKTLTGSGDFTVTGTCSDGGTVPCAPIVTFTPSSAGAKSGTIAINSGADNSPISITLSGTGVTPSTHHVLLTWAASPSSVTGYNVYRAVSGNSFTTPLNGGTPVNALTYTDTTPTPGTTYVYGITAVGAAGFSWPAGAESLIALSNTVTP